MIYENIGQLVQGQQLQSIADDQSVYAACTLLDKFNIGALPVMRNGTLVGIISERDVVRRVVMQGRHFVETIVAQVMTPNPQVIDPEAGLVDALGKMIAGRFRHLPVVHEGETIGMVSIRDIPTDYWVMRKRYEDFIVTPVVEAETALNQLKPLPVGDIGAPVSDIHIGL